MKRLGIREFRDHATRYLAGDDVLAIERYGRPIGFYIPAGAVRQERHSEALERLEQTIQRVMAETGYTEEDLSRLFDLNTPPPETPRRRRRLARAKAHAPGR